MTTMKLETPWSVIWKKCKNKIRESTEAKLFLVCPDRLTAMRPPFSLDRFGLSHWWSTEKEFFVCFFVGWLVVVVFRGVGVGRRFYCIYRPCENKLM